MRYQGGQVYYELFVGGCGVLPHVDGVRVAGDLDKDLIAFWSALQAGYVPPNTLTKDEYDTSKANPETLDAKPFERAFIAYFCSFGGKRWGGYAQDKQGFDYAECSSRQSIDTVTQVKTVSFIHSRYYDLPYVDNSIIYCDPPYANTTTYKTGTFDSFEFWLWLNT